jgi:hypothetical protein
VMILGVVERTEHDDGRSAHGGPGATGRSRHLVGHRG